jgi:hypothetical protein
MVCVAGFSATTAGPFLTGAEPTNAEPKPNGPVDVLKLDCMASSEKSRDQRGGADPKARRWLFRATDAAAAGPIASRHTVTNKEIRTRVDIRSPLQIDVERPR